MTFTPYYERENVLIYHANCKDVITTLEGVEAVISDPPYGMGYNTNSTRFVNNGNGHGNPSKRSYPPVYGDDEPFNPTFLLDYPRVVLFGSNHFYQYLPVGTTLIWIKKSDKGFGTFLSDAEIAWMKGGVGVYCKRDTSHFGEMRSRTHPTQKPVSIMQWCIEKSKVPTGGLILDPYMGSGTTLIASVRLNHRVIGIEIEEQYCEIAATRIDKELDDRKQGV